MIVTDFYQITVAALSSIAKNKRKTVSLDEATNSISPAAGGVLAKNLRGVWLSSFFHSIRLNPPYHYSTSLPPVPCSYNLLIQGNFLK